MRHLSSPTPGECIAGNELEHHGWTVYLPAKDVGIDLLAERHGRLVRVQVKESRTYENLNAEMGWHSWSQREPDALTRADALGIDLFVFVVHTPDEQGSRRRFLPFCVVISPRELEERLRAYRSGSDRAVAWFRESPGRLWEVRGRTTRKAGARFGQRERDFSRYLDNLGNPSGPRGTGNDVQ